MEVNSNCEYVVLLGKKCPIIQCNIDLNPITMPKIDDNTKEALLRQVSTKSDPDEDIYSAENSTSSEQENSVEAVATLSNVNVSLPDTNLSQNEERVPTDDMSGATVNDEVQQDETVTDPNDVRPVSPTDIDAVVNLALSVEDTNIEQTFEYTVAEDTVQSNESETANVVAEPSAVEQPVSVNTMSVSEESVETTDRNSAANTTHDIVQSDNASLPVHEETEIIFPPDVNDDEIDAHLSLSTKLDILDYAKSEWKGTTFTAKCLRSGYQKLIKETGCTLMRQVRGDNYCALRAAAFQILTRNVKVLCCFSDWKEHLATLPQRLLQLHGCSWLNQWTFADRLPCKDSNRISMMNNCLYFFIEQKELSDAMVDEMDKEAHFSALFNSGSLAEIKLFEAIKLLMLETAVELYNANSKGEDVPVFAWLLFARDTSEDPKNLMLNHLNPAGKSGGLEQVEMCLLGQALQITVQVYRPSNVNQEDFVTHYPDHKLQEWDKISLIAEDDRHYNIVVK